jgi:hypothetical protein
MLRRNIVLFSMCLISCVSLQGVVIAAESSEVSLVPLSVSKVSSDTVKISANFLNNSNQELCYWKVLGFSLGAKITKASNGRQLVSAEEPYIVPSIGSDGTVEAIKYRISAKSSVTIEQDFVEPVDHLYLESSNTFGKKYKRHDVLKYRTLIRISSCTLSQFSFEKVTLVESSSTIRVRF